MDVWDGNEFTGDEYGECYFCFAPCSADNFCSGCDEYICAVCGDVFLEDLLDTHIPEDHQLEIGRAHV